MSLHKKNKHGNNAEESKATKFYTEQSEVKFLEKKEK